MSFLCSEPLSRAFHFRQRESQRPCNDKPVRAHLVPHSRSAFIFCFSLPYSLPSATLIFLLFSNMQTPGTYLSSPMVDSLLPMQELWVWALVREVRSHMLQWMAKKKKTPKNKQKTCKCLSQSLWIFLELLPYLQNSFPMALILTFLKSLLRSHILKEFSPDHHM